MLLENSHHSSSYAVPASPRTLGPGLTSDGHHPTNFARSPSDGGCMWIICCWVTRPRTGLHQLLLIPTFFTRLNLPAPPPRCSRVLYRAERVGQQQRITSVAKANPAFHESVAKAKEQRSIAHRCLTRRLVVSART